MNILLLRLFIRLFNVIAEQADQFRYEDSINRDFWSSIRRKILAIQSEVTAKFDL